jgi:2-phospho-L-lactate guanylyltransferase
MADRRSRQAVHCAAMTFGGSLSVLVPVKAFARAKARLAPTLTPAERAELARSMAESVLRAAGGLDVWVVCDDDDVAAWARDLGAEVAWHPGTGLDGAVSAACTERFAHGATRVAVVHGDLPLIESMAWHDQSGDAVVLVPDRHGKGTNVISTPTPAFRFAYGPGSFARHVAEVERLGLELCVVHDLAMGWDIDVPSDLSAIDGSLRGPSPSR